jgi:hypothetical protein
MITQDALKELLSYNPETGDFTWLKAITNSIRVGGLAGTCNNLGYWKIKIFGKLYGAHRLAWLYTYGSFPPDQTDHINGRRDDNRIENLRAVTNSENTRNGKRRYTNTSGVTGVRWRKQDQSWQAQISDKGKQLHLGLFKDLFSAVAVRKSAESKYGYHPNHGRGA